MNEAQSATTSCSPDRAPSAGPGLLLLVLVTLAVFVVKLTGPSNLMDNDQERPASYVMDAVLHGHWWCQTDWTGDIMSKPPLFTWIAALATLLVGHANLFSLYFPCLVSMLLVVWLLFRSGRSHFGWTAGFLAALMYIAAPSGVKHIALARTDGLFAATIALTALLGFRAWTTGRGWVGFWLGAALTTLTKGPLGVLLAAMGLLAVVWEKWATRGTGGTTTTSPPQKEPVATLGNASLPGHAVGLLLFVGITGGWFWLAYQQSGQPFIDKVIGKELVGHVVGGKHGTFGIGFVKAPLYWLSRFLPWTLLGLVGLWRVVRHPASDPGERRFERFLFCWVVGGLFLFSLATHQRGDLPLPLYPATALLAGRELSRWLGRWEQSLVVKRAMATAAVALAAYAVYLHAAFARTEVVRESEGMESLARQLRGEDSLPRLLHVDSPYALQFHLNTMDLVISFEEAAAALKSEEPVAVAVHALPQLRAALGSGIEVHTLASWPGGEKGQYVSILSNASTERGQRTR